MKSKLKKCKACGAEIARNANVCPKCGANLVMRKPGVIIGLVIWIVAMFCIMKACGVFDSSSSQSDAQATSSESVEAASNSSSKSGDMVILDSNNLRITYTGIELTQYLPGQSNGYMLSVGLTIENNSDMDITVYPQNATVNGIMKTAGSGVPLTVLSGKKSVTSFCFANLDNTGIDSAQSVDQVKEVVFQLSIMDSNSNEIVKSDTITINP